MVKRNNNLSIDTQKGYDIYAAYATKYWKAAGSNRKVYTCWMNT